MKLEKIYHHIVTLVNAVLVLLMVHRVHEIDNDKGILLIIFLVPMLIILNGIGWGVMKHYKKDINEVFKFNAFLLLFIFIPLLLFCASF